MALSTIASIDVSLLLSAHMQQALNVIKRWLIRNESDTSWSQYLISACESKSTNLPQLHLFCLFGAGAEHSANHTSCHLVIS